VDSKGPDAFRTISEVAGDLDLPQHVLRFWETRFSQIKPLKRGGGRRYYRPDDVDLLRGIRHLLYDEGYTIKGVQRILKERGIRFVSDTGNEETLASADHGEAVEANEKVVNDAHSPGPVSAPSGNGEAIPAAPTAARDAARENAHHGATIGDERDEGAAASAPVAPSAAVPTAAAPTAAAPTAAAPTATALAPQSNRSSARSRNDGHEEPVPRDIILDDPPARKADGRSLMDKIRGVQEPEPVESSHPAQLSRDDIRRLQSTLFELLECKRILDRSRSG